ncbi:hypothetical protein [Ktedonospora formicarum]|uniref:Uncharacterized protein n=1 Tax=Ktedonospora formicarum TaxID=2778364 RepID=A0A8J3MUH2_9CHLR|nr:hypothetical protein [Ktedonospora formicarum]GHO46618.1 hypothetical protein KSX_47810 [Ktedonospora formicarum]
MNQTFNIVRVVRDWYVAISAVLTFAFAISLRFFAASPETWFNQPGHIIGTLILIDSLLVCWQFTEGIAHERREAQAGLLWPSVALVLGALLAMIGVALTLYTAPITWTSMLFIMGASRLLVIVIPFLLFALQRRVEQGFTSQRKSS